MKVLGIDTATYCGSIGLIDGDQVVAEYALHLEQTHSARLIPSIEALLKGAQIDLRELDALAITLGPGSFTGIRVGLSAVKGMALAAEKPVVGVPTLDALAHNIPFTPYLICPILDARKGEVYTAFYTAEEEGRVTRVTPYQALSPAAMIEGLPSQKAVFLGDGVRVYSEYLKERLGERACLAPSHLSFLRGTTVAELGHQRLTKGEVDDISSLVPMYIRPSDAEIHEGKAHASE